MNTYEDERASVVPFPDPDAIQLAATQQTRHNKLVATVLNSHSIMIDDLNKRVKDTVAFMEWVGNTHPNVWEQYKAIKDLEEVSK
jgi:hypothetical protein